MLQHLKHDLEKTENGLYVAADHTWFYSHSLRETAMDWYKIGGNVLFIDNVHKYPTWSRELKNIYDGIPKMKVIFSASSALDIFRGEADLSRRALTFSLPGLSFREYLNFTQGTQFDPWNLAHLIQQHRPLSRTILDHLQPLPHFKKYLQSGYLPFILKDGESYLPNLEKFIDTTIGTELNYVANYNKGTAYKLKKLFSFISQSAPYKPNISDLATQLDLSRESVYEYFYQLVDAKLLNVLSRKDKWVSRFQKPDKVYLENPNLIYALTETPDLNNIHKTYLLTHLVNSGLKTFVLPTGDFLVNDLAIEVGEMGKPGTRVKNHEKNFIAVDNIEMGIGSDIPLWMFGFLY